MPQAIASKPGMSWQDSVWFSDVGDTLIDTAGTSLIASGGVRSVFEARFGSDKADEVQTNFNNLFALMMAGYRVRNEDDWRQIEGGKRAFDDLVAYVASCQRQVTATYGRFKKWSREVFVKHAAELAGLAVTPELVHEAADAYWLTLTEQTQVSPDALGLSRVIAEHQRPLFLVTSSDARLKMQPDGQFIYEPAYSEALKRERIELLREKGLQFNAISIGDPEDKPHPDFFNKALKVAASELGMAIDTSTVIMLGDSFGGDLETPKEKLGFGLVVLKENGHTDVQIDDAQQITLSNLLQAARYFA